MQHGDYINASWITSSNSTYKFIAAQSPLPRTVAHFLQMIQEQNVSMVVSLTEEAEHQDGDGKIENQYCE